MDIRTVASAYGAKQVSPAPKSEKKVVPEKTAAVQNEQVQLSETSLSMQKLKEIIDNTPETRIKVVEEIRTKIKNNGYPLESNFYKALQNMFEDKTI